MCLCQPLKRDSKTIKQWARLKNGHFKQSAGYLFHKTASCEILHVLASNIAYEAKSAQSEIKLTGVPGGLKSFAVAV